MVYGNVNAFDLQALHNFGPFLTGELRSVIGKYLFE